MNTRICSRCGQEKNLEDFPVNKAKKLGRAYWCRACFVSYYRAKDMTPGRREQHATWRHSERGRAITNLRRKLDRQQNKAKYRAKEMIEKLVNMGVIKRESCVECGNDNSQGHHPDYAKPLEVVWLCQKHHSERHRKY